MPKRSKETEETQVLDSKSNENLKQDSFLLPNRNICSLHGDIIKHQTVLLTETILSLSFHTPEMYKEVSMYTKTLAFVSD